jgi:lipopolysaccharide/colanic/teichoic acid biosynthesis glycosyltransferase
MTTLRRSEYSTTDDAEFALPADFTLSRPSFPVVQIVLKRAFDVVGAFGLLVLFFPVLLAAAVAVRLSSPGPVLFRQKRWGRFDDQFSLWKFRTMHVDQTSLVPPSTLRQLQARGILFKPRNDPRVTRVGAFLRKTSIDELPQLFNVLVGDMSLVGPRPLMLHMLDPYPELRRVRGQIRPGITGLWQISERASNETALQMARYDLSYIRELSLAADARILLKTPAAVLSGKGAH